MQAFLGQARPGVDFLSLDQSSPVFRNDASFSLKDDDSGEDIF